MGSKYTLNWYRGSVIVHTYATNSVVDALWHLLFTEPPVAWFWRSLEVR